MTDHGPSAVPQEAQDAILIRKIREWREACRKLREFAQSSHPGMDYDELAAMYSVLLPPTRAFDAEQVIDAVLAALAASASSSTAPQEPKDALGEFRAELNQLIVEANRDMQMFGIEHLNRVKQKSDTERYHTLREVARRLELASSIVSSPQDAQEPT